MLKRSFDILFSFIGLIILLPFFIIIALFIVFDSKGGIFYIQKRVGLNQKEFKIFKFRTMCSNAEKKGLLTVGYHDSRITKVGYFLRKFKIDELPQLINVLFGTMSFVGPRPEVKKYVDLYSNEQLKVLSIKPGITDYASIEYSNENEILANSENPDKTYIEEIMPAKLVLNIKYINEMSFIIDLKIIFNTFFRITKH